MSTANVEKSQVFKDKRGQDRRQGTSQAKKIKKERRKIDRRNMEFSELPWWLQRNYVDAMIEPTKVKAIKASTRSKPTAQHKKKVG
jgi:Fe-S oxidoreductase